MRPYVVNDDLRIAKGVTLEIAENVQLTLNRGVEMIVDGTLDINSANSINAVHQDCCSGPSGIIVNGTLSAADTNFDGGGRGTRMVVNPGGKLEATNSTFLWEQIWFAPESDLDDGDLTENTIASTVHVAAEKVSQLADNKSFANVFLHGGELNKGEAPDDVLTLRVIGTEDSGAMQYWLAADYTIQEATTLEVAENVRLTINRGVEIIVDGTLDITSVDSISAVPQDCCSGPSGIIVNGTLTAIDTNFDGGGRGTRMVVNPRGKLEATNSTFLWDVTMLQDTAVGVLHLNRFAKELAISGSATTDIVKNDLSRATILPTGDESLPIDLRLNWWGTIDQNTIGQRLPANVDFISFLDQPPTAPNLEATSLNITSTHPLVGQSIDVEFSITNRSPSAAGSTVTGFLLNSSNRLDDAALLGTVETPAIAAQGSFQQKVKLTLPDATHAVWEAGFASEYTISVVVDAFDKLVEWNEDNNVASTTVSFADPATVVARRLFYNNSLFDGHEKAATDLDDLVVAPDKLGLLPGEEVSTAHISYFSRGINGIAIDVANLRSTPEIQDFQFSIAFSPDASSFRPAPVPSSIVLRAAAGTRGSDRVMITWDDEAIENQWLRIEILPTSATGLDRPDVFFFGSEILPAANAKATDIDLLHALFQTGSNQLEHDLAVEQLVQDTFGTRAGDTDLDQDVDFRDFINFSNNFRSSTPTWSAGDFNGDGEIDFEDFVQLASNFGFKSQQSG